MFLEARGGYKMSQWRVRAAFLSVQVAEGLWAKPEKKAMLQNQAVFLEYP